MIKQIYLVRLAADDEQFKALDEFFAVIGLDRAEEWQGRHNKGVLFRSARFGIEVGSGGDFPRCDLVMEVADANSAYDFIRQRGFKIAEEISDRRFGGRMFLVEPVPGQKVAIFSYLPEKRPQHQTVHEGRLDAKGKRFAIIVSRFNSFITERLLDGALDALHRSEAKDQDIEILRVPGAFEIPAAARTMAQTGRVDAVICLGCIIRGETSHYEHIATEVTRGIGQSAQETGVPHAYGVLTCENLEQAIDRAGLKTGNKGFEAAMAAIEMASLKGKVTGK